MAHRLTEQTTSPHTQMAMTHEEELSELATKVTFYALCVAALLAFAADQACAHGWGCAVAHVLPKIPYYLAILVPLLLPPAIVLFFVRAAGSSTKAVDGKSISVKDVDFSMVLLLLLLLSTMLGTISFAFYKYGYPESCNLLGHASVFFIFLCEALVYVRAALAQWMNPKPSNMVAAE